MNSGIPDVWLWISGIFFLLGILALCVSLFVMLKVLKIAEEMKPKLDSVVTKVEELTLKLDSVADKADETLASVKQSVEGVGGKAQGILGAVEAITLAVATKFDGIAPLINGALAAYKIFNAVKARKTDKTKPAPKPLPMRKKR